MSSFKRNEVKTIDLCKTFASQATTHGIRRILETETNCGKFVWTIIFLSALAGCTYHCSFLVMKYLRFEKVTTTEEIHSKELQFPALTVCNLNILKKQFLADQLETNKELGHERGKGFCYPSEDAFLNKSNTKDLSDIWANLGVTLPHLKNYGHKVYDLIVQCTYNSKDCFNQSIKEDLPLQTENITITDYPSTRLGYCHTIKLNQSTLGLVRRTGQTLGLTLTLNIERNEYWNLLSPEYGVRIMVHPQAAYPTVDRGGIVLHPGTKSYLSIRIREINRLPSPYGDCTESFDSSPLKELLKSRDENILKYHNYYTYEFCQLICREMFLLENCSCVEEQVNSTSSRFCNPCNTTDATCRDNFKKNFDDNDNNECTSLCKPACQDVRYDLTLSTSEWPNLEFQEFVLQRWPELIPDFVENNQTVKVNGTIQLNETFINKNFLRAHIFIQEMNYLRYNDKEAYTLPELFADLGGCLGLYIGVSLISIIELHELFLHIFLLFITKLNRSFNLESSKTNHYENNVSKGQSRSSVQLMNVQQKGYSDNFRPEGPTPPIFWMRERKDQEILRKKICLKCLSDAENYRGSYLYRRRPMKSVKGSNVISPTQSFSSY